MGPNLLFDKLMSKIRHSQIGNLQVINSTLDTIGVATPPNATAGESQGHGMEPNNF
jgi:hypothetical protein